VSFNTGQVVYVNIYIYLAHSYLLFLGCVRFIWAGS
jgi:hypothetical protein